MLLLLSYHFDLDIIRVVIIISFIIISFYVVTICFIFDGARLCWGLEVWQISGEVENKRNSSTHEVDVNVDKTFIYRYIYYNIQVSTIFNRQIKRKCRESKMICRQ